ncbi:MAG: 1-acyl-sn-glycerol-3-phosphate acyltransferase [Synechococcales cyanobacterium T60_A2020_003]|nr:1-acyl-sn-glycerol-3-phosphate acyltransferase [Synechococcales cyanobacterium T60_A2020_003]
MPHTSITQVQPPLEFIPPQYTPSIQRAAKVLLPPFMRWSLGIIEHDTAKTEILVDLYEKFQSDRARFLIAFRHPSPTDPFCIAHFLWNQVPTVARQRGVQLKRPTHAHFVYDRGIPLWAGQVAGWGIARLGGTPIRRGGLDRKGLKSVRSLFAEGQFPMAASPEGGTNQHNELVSPLEPGIAQFGFWCHDDRLSMNQPAEVFLLPLGVQYNLVGQPWRKVEAMLRQLEKTAGLYDASDLQLQDDQFPTEEQLAGLYKRLYALGWKLLSEMEGYYLRFYRHALPAEIVEALTKVQARNEMPPENDGLAHRLQTLLSAALTVAEQFFQLPTKGGIIDRCRRVEQAAWERIYREDIVLNGLTPVEQGLADRIAEEANLRLWHMRLVENFVSVTGQYVMENPSVDRFADTLTLLWKTVARIERNEVSPPNLGDRKVLITVGDPISVSDRWLAYQSNRRQAVSLLTQDLQDALENLIVTSG